MDNQKYLECKFENRRFEIQVCVIVGISRGLAGGFHVVDLGDIIVCRLSSRLRVHESFPRNFVCGNWSLFFESVNERSENVFYGETPSRLCFYCRKCSIKSKTIIIMEYKMFSICMVPLVLAS